MVYPYLKCVGTIIAMHQKLKNPYTELYTKGHSGCLFQATLPATAQNLTSRKIAQ